MVSTAQFLLFKLSEGNATMNAILDRLLESEEDTHIIERFLSTRSVLYNLEPVGVGTPYVESLTSYISRLANEHNVKVSSLFRLIGEYTDKEFFKKKYGESSIKYNSLSYINGFGFSCIETVKALEKLTARKDIQFLTLLNWSEIFVSNPVGKYKKWCPYCLDNMKKEEDVIYEPLIWYMSDIDKCDIHGTSLCEKCPECGKRLPFISDKNKNGYCKYCHTWLGISNRLTEQRVLSENEKFIIRYYKQLFANAPYLKSYPIRNSLRQMLLIVRDRLGFNSLNSFSKFLGVAQVGLYNNESFTEKLSNNNLIKVCKKLNCTIYDLLFGSKVNITINVEKYNNRSSHQNRYTKSEIENCLKDAIALDVPKSLWKICTESGFSVNTAKRHCPSLCDFIKERYNDYKNKVTEDKLKEIEGILKDAVENSKYISPYEVVKQFGMSANTVKEKLPDLWKMVINNNQKYNAKVQEKREEKILIEIEKTIIKLHLEGNYPSKHQIIQRMNHPFLFVKEVENELWKITLTSLGYSIR